MPVRPITGSGFSSLPTPKARDAQAEGYEAGMRRVSPQVGTIVKAIVDGDERIELFGTLTTATSGRSAEFRGKGTNVVEFAEEIAEQQNQLGGGSCYQQQPLQIGKAQTTADQVQPAAEVSPRLLPTTRRSMGNASQPEVAAGDPKKRIENTVLLGDVSWGKFEPAIRRWEQVLGRPAPLPTKPDGKDGAHRLSSKFTEWMMGLPDGWVTDCGLSRNEELKACGNGVVPQQAELALRMLLDGIDLRVGGGK